MALFYVVMALGVVVLNIHASSGSLCFYYRRGFLIRQHVTGGLVGSMFVSLKKGVSRGIFSNEAGLGTGSIAHACADTKKPVKQGMFGIFEVFADTFVICTLTALVILCSGVSDWIWQAGRSGTDDFMDLQRPMAAGFPFLRQWLMCCFAFSTIIGWGLYGARCIEYLCSQ